MILKQFSAILLITILIFPAFGQPNTSTENTEPPFKWQVGEELFYSVKYAFLTVGSLQFQVLEEKEYHGQQVYHCRMIMKSSSAIPFVDMDDTFDSYVDADSIYTHLFWASEKQSDHMLYTIYDMDYKNLQIQMNMEKRFPTDTVAVLDSIAKIPDIRVKDGLSLLLYARAYAETKDVGHSVPVFLLNELGSTTINFTGTEDEASVKGNDLDGYFLDGKMKFVGIAGIKDDFEGWFSQDNQRIPVHAKMKAFIGSVRLNLEWWKKWDGEKILGEKAIRKNNSKLLEIEKKMTGTQ